jgi:hypothetical protein
MFGRTDLRKIIHAKHYETDKAKHGYLPIYEQYFENLVDKDMKLLELGVYKGDSLLLWRDYFEKGTIVGLDIESVDIEDTTDRIHVYQGYQQDTELLDRIASEQAPDGFDVIIDDCSHIGELTRISFWHLFENHLKPGGIYAIEDFNTGYSGDFPDGGSFRLAVDAGSIGLRQRVIPSLRWMLNNILYRMLPDRILLTLKPHINSRGSQMVGSIVYKKVWPSHMYGMVGFVKELVDACCLNDSIEAEWGGCPRRNSKVEQLHIYTNIAIVTKSSRNRTIN